jgi:hypothetical protein
MLDAEKTIISRAEPQGRREKLYKSFPAVTAAQRE